MHFCPVLPSPDNSLSETMLESTQTFDEASIQDSIKEGGV